MAYDANKEHAEPGNPYLSLTRQPSGGPTLDMADHSDLGAPLAGGNSGPTATGHVNFDQVYNANAGVAGREAGKLQTSAGAKGQAAQSGLTGAQKGFSQAVRTGTVQGPTDQQKTWAQYGLTTGAQVAPASPGPGQSVYTPPPSDADAEGSVRAGAASKYSGPNALSAMEQYSKLAQDTAAAQDEATALASGNEGLQAEGMNQTDAALLGAAGRSGFEQLGRRYGGLKDQLDAANKASIGEADRSRAQSDAAIAQYKALIDQADARKAGAGGAPGSPTDTPTASGNPTGYGSYDDFMNNPGWSESLHEGGMALSPADWATRGLGELGYTGQNASELFGKTVAGGAAPQDDWAKANVHTAMQQVMHEYGQEAAKYLFEHMTQEQWDSYLAGGNAGNVARMMRAWLESAGYQKTQQHGTPGETGTDKGGSTVKQAGYTGGEADQGTTAEQETARLNAYREGWGASYDEQFRNGNKSPTAP